MRAGNILVGTSGPAQQSMPAGQTAGPACPVNQNPVKHCQQGRASSVSRRGLQPLWHRQAYNANHPDGVLEDHPSRSELAAQPMVSHRDMRLTSLLHGLACPAAADPSCLPADRFAALKEINNLLGRPDRTARFNAMTRSLQVHPDISFRGSSRVIMIETVTWIVIK